MLWGRPMTVDSRRLPTTLLRRVKLPLPRSRVASKEQRWQPRFLEFSPFWSEPNGHGQIRRTFACKALNRRPGLEEFDLGYYGWRVVLAACLGVMAGFGSLFVCTFAGPSIRTFGPSVAGKSIGLPS